jgi:hypothetical protein
MALKFIEDRSRIGSGGPGKGLLMEVVVSNVLVDPLYQFPHAAKRTSADGVFTIYVVLSVPTGAKIVGSSVYR